MEITQLNYFKTIARCENMTRAAEELDITQSALSRSMHALEDDIGFQLFERTGNRIMLNRNGEFFLIRVKDVLNTLENAVSETKAMAGLEYGSVSVGLSNTIFIKNIILDYLKRHPRTHLTCHLMSDEQIAQSLEEGSVNFAVTRNPIYGRNILWKEIFEDHMMVMLPEGHPLERRKGLYLDELASERFIISNVGFHMQSEVVELCRKAGFQPDYIYEGAGEDLSGLLVREGLGIMIAPYSIVAGVREMKLSDAPADKHGVPLLDDFAKSSIGIASRFKSFQPEAALELYNDLTQYFGALKKTDFTQG